MLIQITEPLKIFGAFQDKLKIFIRSLLNSYLNNYLLSNYKVQGIILDDRDTVFHSPIDSK